MMTNNKKNVESNFYPLVYYYLARNTKKVWGGGVDLLPTSPQLS